MAEPKRIEFKTIPTTSVDKNCEKPSLTRRFTLTLGESTATTCPEFSFTELLKKEKGVSEHQVDRPFEDEDNVNHDEVAALARKFEEKYGPKPSKKKRLKCLEDDFYDLGDGYDENDPFIDNTEAYDEVVPSCLTTQHGGFYINRGALDFKTLSEPEDSGAEFTPTARKRGRPKKILDSDSAEEGDNEPKKKKVKKLKKFKEGVEGEKKQKKISVSADGDKIVKRKVSFDPHKKNKASPTVAELLKQQTVATSAGPAVNGNADLDISASPPPSDYPASEKGAVQDCLDAVLKDALQDDSGEMLNGDEGVNPLPVGLAAGLSSTIDNIKQAARDNKEGKCKFFSGDVNRMLLEIEIASRQLAGGQRSAIFAHLADYLPCGKETLVKRAKKLRESQQDDQLKIPIQRLKDAINEVMPHLQELHDQEVLKFRMESKEKGDDADPGKEEGGNTESDEEEKPLGGGLGDGVVKRGNRGPRKKFKWTPEIKKLLNNIVSIKMQLFDTYKIRNQSPEDYLRTFLENEIKTLWPQGWIQTRMLFKESRTVHGSWTNIQKPKKPVLVAKTASPPQVAHSFTPELMVDNSRPKSVSVNLTDIMKLSSDELVSSQIVPKDLKVNITPTLLDIPDIPLLSTPVDILNTSPNSLAKVASATAAAVAAAVSRPRFDPLAFADQQSREHLMTDILKESVQESANTSVSPQGTPRTPTTPGTPQIKDMTFSPFLAEFDRYLSSRHGVSVCGTGSQNKQLTSLQLKQLQQKQQTHSKTVSSTVDKLDANNLMKSRQMPVQWHMDTVLGEAKPRSSPYPAATSMQNAQSSSRVSTLSMASNSSSLLQQPVIYPKTGIIQGKDSLNPANNPKAAMIRDQILVQIKAEVDAAASATRLSTDDFSRNVLVGGSTSQPYTKIPAAGRQSQLSATPTAAHTSNHLHSSPGSKQQQRLYSQALNINTKTPLPVVSSPSQSKAGSNISARHSQGQILSTSNLLGQISSSDPHLKFSGTSVLKPSAALHKNVAEGVALTPKSTHLSGRSSQGQRILTHGQQLSRKNLLEQKTSQSLNVTYRLSSPMDKKVTLDGSTVTPRSMSIYEKIEQQVKQSAADAAMEEQALKHLARVVNMPPPNR